LRRCPNCGKKPIKKFYNRGWFWFLIFVVIVIFLLSNSDKLIDTTNMLSDTYGSNKISPEEYKEQCDEVPYEDLARTPNEFKNKDIKFTGEVFQIEENNRHITLLIHVTPSIFGIYVDTIYIDYIRTDSDEKRILEGDLVTVYGKSNGIMTYTSILDKQISVPHVIAKFIDLN
jgi:hypothetical protein